MRDAPSLPPEPRSFAGTAIMQGGLTVLPFAILFSWLTATEQRPFSEVLPVGLGAGCLFGVMFGPTMAYFFQGETGTVEFAERADFVARLNVATSQLGYNPASTAEDFLTYRPSFQAGLTAGRISVALGEHEAVVVGPRLYVRKLLAGLHEA